MEAHKNVAHKNLFMNTLSLKIGRKLKFFISVKNFPERLKKNPIHFHNTCFYQARIQDKNAKQDI